MYGNQVEFGRFMGRSSMRVTEWKREDAGNIWWKALNECPALQSFCKANPGITVYGEVYGNVQDLKYGAKNGQVWFVAFDLLRNGEWVDHNEAREIGHVLPWVPVIYHGPFGDGLFELADGSLLSLPNMALTRFGRESLLSRCRSEPTLKSGGRS